MALDNQYIMWKCVCVFFGPVETQKPKAPHAHKKTPPPPVQPAARPNPRRPFVHPLARLSPAARQRIVNRCLSFAARRPSAPARRGAESSGATEHNFPKMQPKSHDDDVSAGERMNAQWHETRMQII